MLKHFSLVSKEEQNNYLKLDTLNDQLEFKLHKLGKELEKHNIYNEFGDENQISLNEFGLDFTVGIKDDFIVIHKFYSPYFNIEDLSKEIGKDYDWNKPSKEVEEIIHTYLFNDPSAIWSSLGWNKGNFEMVFAIFEVYIANISDDLHDLAEEINFLYNDEKFYGRYHQEKDLIIRFLKEKVTL